MDPALEERTARLWVMINGKHCWLNISLSLSTNDAEIKESEDILILQSSPEHEYTASELQPLLHKLVLAKFIDYTGTIRTITDRLWCIHRVYPYDDTVEFLTYRGEIRIKRILSVTDLSEPPEGDAEPPQGSPVLPPTMPLDRVGGAQAEPLFCRQERSVP